MSQRGFTLIETLIVVIIITIMASIAIPNYNRAVEQGRWRAARDILEAVYSGERVYWTTNNTYINVAAGGPWNTIYMDTPNGGALPATFTVTGAAGIGGAAVFTATATRNGGGCDTQTITINQGRVIGGTWPANGAC